MIFATSLSSTNMHAQATYTLKATPKMVTALAAAQEANHPLVYAKHVEPPYYPPLPRMARVSGTVEMKLKIGVDGKVLSVESMPGKGKVSSLLKDDAEKNVKTWTFGCVGCPPNAPFEHTIKFEYALDDKLPDRTTKTMMDLPDEVTMSAGPVPIEPATTSNKRSQ